ncbi:MAG: Uma2 family endonuclease, partial [Treponema sp.]|nr:Uma2 family endonuclease [Treponema sp.]
MSNLALAEDIYYTYADYKDWELKPGERYELIRGVPYAMSAPNLPHQRVLMALAVEIHGFLKGKPCEVFAAPLDVRLFYEEDESDDTVVQPDIVVICDEAKKGYEGCRGAPELAVEILSPSNTAIEMERKLNLYREAEIGEYWIADPKNKHIRVYRLEKGRYEM